MIIINREDFPILNNDIIYFDNGATTLKPKCVVEAMNDYYYNYGANIHRGDYKISLKASEEYEKVRDKVKDFINAKSSKEIVFTSGATDSLNKIVFGFMKYYLNENDEVLITKSEHASNVLPWFELAKEKNLKIKYIPLNENHEVTIDNLEKAIEILKKQIIYAKKYRHYTELIKCSERLINYDVNLNTPDKLQLLSDILEVKIIKKEINQNKG